MPIKKKPFSFSITKNYKRGYFQMKISERGKVTIRKINDPQFKLLPELKADGITPHLANIKRNNNVQKLIYDQYYPQYKSEFQRNDGLEIYKEKNDSFIDHLDTFFSSKNNHRDFKTVFLKFTNDSKITFQQIDNSFAFNYLKFLNNLPNGKYKNSDKAPKISPNTVLKYFEPFYYNCRRYSENNPEWQMPITKREFKQRAPKQPPGNRTYYSTDEINKLENHPYLSKENEEEKKLWLFMFYTGLALVDAKKLRYIDIVEEKSKYKNFKCFKITRQKPNYKHIFIVPLTEKALDLIDYNSKKKSKELIFNLKRTPDRQDVRRTLTKWKNQIGIQPEHPARYHDARRSFGRNMYDKRHDIISVMHMMGHKQPTETANYIGVTSADTNRLYETVFLD